VVSREQDADVVVAGAGAAGLAAALTAAEAGLSVILLDAKETYRTGSNTAMSTSMVPAGGSRWQEALGIDDSPELFLADIMRKTHGEAEPQVARALASASPELVGWMADALGIPWELVTDFRYPGHSRDRCHALADRSGRSLHRLLLRAVAGQPLITLAVPMRLVDIRMTGESAVSGVEIETPDESRESISTPAVVLATNGFGADQDLVRRHIPEIAEGVYHGSDGSFGDAVRIGERLGLDLGYLDAYQGHGSLASPHGVLLTWAAVMHGAFLVNERGERFGDETVGYSEYAAKTLAQPSRIAWTIYDARIDEACRPFADYQDVLSSHAVRWADDLPGLASLIGADAEVLQRTVGEADLAARGGSADSFGRSQWGAPLEAPYAAVKVTGALFHTQGGLRVDGHARVLRGGRPVPGLYAAGGAAAGISGHGAAGYLAGNGLLSALGLGFLAGRHLHEPANV
jgi:fumarate reductase flavoprotein subunit